MEACYHHNRIKNRALRKCEKSHLGVSPLVATWVREVPVGSKNRFKIYQHMKPKMDRLLASIFLWIVVGLGEQIGRRNRAKSEQKTIETRIENMMKKRYVLEASRGGGTMHALRRVVDPGTS